MLFQFYLKVTAAKSEEELVSLKRNGVLVYSFLNAGWLNNLTLGNKNLAMQTFMVHFVLQKRKELLDQLCKGLNTLGVLDQEFEFAARATTLLTEFFLPNCMLFKESAF